MAELQFPSIVGGFLQGRQLGQQVADRRTEQENAARISQLAQQAYGAAPTDRGALIGQAIGIDPGRGLEISKALGSEDDAREQRLLSTARLIDAAPPEQKAAIYQNVRPQIAQYLPNLPDTYNDQVGQGIRAFITSRGGGQNLGDRYRVVGGTLVDLQNPTQAIYRAPQIINADQGIFEYGQGGLQPLGAGGAQVGPIGAVQPGSSFSIGADVPPEVAAQIRAQEAASGGVPAAPMLTPRGAGADQERLALAREANARAAQSSQLAAEAAARSQREAEQRQRFGTIPPGFRVNAEGTALEPVPGGPKPAGAAATEGERKAATLLNRLEFSLGQLNQAVRESPSAASPSVGAALAGAIPFVGEQARNIVNPAERQRVEAAQLDVLDAALTLGTGAAYTREQLEGYRRSYFPQIGDSDSTIADKAARLQNVLGAARIAAGRAAPQTEGRYQVGQIIEAGGKRYRVTGGDMNDPDVEEVR